MSYKIARYGRQPYLPDQRGHLYAAPQEVPGALPGPVCLRPHFPPVHRGPTSCRHAGSFTITNAPSNTRLIPTAARKSAMGSIWTIRVVQ